MLEELKEESIVNKVGGRFKLSTLIQKRMIALNQGARALVDMRGVDKMTLVIQEIMQDKIYLDLSGKLQTSEPTEEPRPPGDYRYLVDESRVDGLLLATALRVPEHQHGVPTIPHVYVNRRGIAKFLQFKFSVQPGGSAPSWNPTRPGMA